MRKVLLLLLCFIGTLPSLSAQFGGAGVHAFVNNGYIYSEPDGAKIKTVEAGEIVVLNGTTTSSSSRLKGYIMWCKTKDGRWVLSDDVKLLGNQGPNVEDYDCTTPPPVLSLLESTLSFSDRSGNDVVDANESSSLSFQLKNEGPGPAQFLHLEVLGTNRSSNGVWVKASNPPERIAPGRSGLCEIFLESDESVEDGLISLQIGANDICGFGIVPFEVSLGTKAFAKPKIKVVDVVSTPASWNRGVPIKLAVLIQNVGEGHGQDVEVNLTLPKGVVCYSGNEALQITDLPSGDAEEVTYEILISNTYEGTVVTSDIDLSERYGRFAESWSRVDSLPQIQVGGAFSFGTSEPPKSGSVNEKKIQRNTRQEGYVEFNSNPKDVIVERVAVVAAQGMDCGGVLRPGQDLASYVEGSLLGYYEVVERRNLERVLDEQKLALSGIMFEKSTVEAGCNIGAQGIIFTEFGCIGGEETIQVKLVDCQTSELYWSATGHGSSILDVVKEIKANLDE